MAEGKVDLPEELFSTKSDVESWGDKGGDDASGRSYEEKELLGLPDDLKDQLTSENVIPLSPQWLYSKSNEFKPGLSALSGESRGQSLSQGMSADSVQKDGWRLDGSQDKKDWRRSVPDIESSRRWREEERETGLLGRRERRKEGERENEFRKSERRVENSSVREATDSRSMPLSDRWHEGGNRNPGQENRRDSKWSSRWGPEDKEESRIEKKADAEKEEARNEKQGFVASSRAPSESDARDKWRPRHRQEAHTGGANVHRAAPGFGLDRGRADGAPTGFAPGRGRSGGAGGLPIGIPPVSGPIGFVSNTETTLRKSSLSADTFRYPRGKLLDIYRKHRITSTFQQTPEGLEDVSPLTETSPVEPLSFVAPDVEEEAALEEIWRGKVTSSEASFNLPREKMSRINRGEKGEIGNYDMLLVGGKPSIGTAEHSESSLKSGGYPCQRNDAGSGFNEHETRANVIAEANSGSLSSKVENNCDVGEPQSVTDSCNYAINETNGVGKLELHSHVKSSETANWQSPAILNVYNKSPDDSSSLFDLSTVNTSESYLKNNDTKLGAVPPEEWSLLYQDPQGVIQGPFLGVDIISWFDQGFFGTDLPVCLSDAPEGTSFRQLGEVMPHLKLRDQTGQNGNNDDSRESSVLMGHTLEESHTGLSVSTSNVKEQRRETSGEGIALSQRDQEISNYSIPIDSHDGAFPSSKSESSFSHCAEEQTFHKLTVPEVEEVIYAGRTASSKANVSSELGTVFHDRGRSANMHELSSSEVGETRLSSQRIPANTDVHPLGLLWSELGAHPKRPLSMNLSAIGGQGHLTHPELVNEASVLRKQHDNFGAVNDLPEIHDAWRNAHNADVNIPRNALQDALVSQQLSRLEQQSGTRHGLEEQLLLHHLQMQHLQQPNLPSPHQQPHLEQLQGPHHQASVNPPVPELEQLLKLGFPPQQILQLQHQQHQLLHHHPMHLLQQHHHQQQQHHHHQQQQQQQQQQHQSHMQQLLFEQLLQQHMHEPSVGRLRTDPIHRNNVLDEVLFREHLLHDLQQQSLPLRHHDASLEHLIHGKLGHGLHADHPKDIMEVLSRPKQSQALRDQQLFLSLQQDHLQGRQFPSGSRPFTVMEEERHAGRPWSVNESGQFGRKPSGQHWSQSSVLSPLDRLHQRQTPFEQPSHLDHHLSLHDHAQHGLYESRSQSFERPLNSSVGVPTLNMELMSRLQGLDLEDQFNHANSLGQASQFTPGIRSHHRQMPNQFNPSRVDAIDAHWSEPDGQLPNSLLESQLHQLHLEAERQKLVPNSMMDSQLHQLHLEAERQKLVPNSMMETQLHQLHLEAERQRRNLRMNLAPEDPIPWAAAGNDEASNQELRDMLHKKLNVHSLHSLEMVDNIDTSYGNKGTAWPFPGPSPDRSLSLLVDQTGHEEDIFGPKMGQVMQEQLVNVGADGPANIVDSGKRSSYPTIPGSLIESEQFFSSVNGTKPNMATDSIMDGSGNQSTEKMDLSEAKEVERGKMRGSKGGSIGLRNFETEVKDNHPEGIISDRLLPVKRPQLSLPSQETHIDLATVPGLRGIDSNAPSFEDDTEVRHGGRGTPLPQAPEAPPTRKDVSFRRTSSSDGDVLGASFIDMLKSTKKPTPEADSQAGALEPDGGQGAKGNKKKGKKGRQIDPSLLGFKVHSNRIMMGEIQRPED